MTNCKGIYGDVNGDGIVNIIDAMFVAQYLAGTHTLTECQLIAADVDGDGIVTATDKQYIANYTVLTKPYGRCGQSFGTLSVTSSTKLIVLGAGVGLGILYYLTKKK